jgi:molybdopterin synthase catalytic subunit
MYAPMYRSAMEMRSPFSLQSAGAEMARLVRNPIDTQSLRNSLIAPEDGAIAVFEGVVRNRARGRPVRYLEYEAYEAMALKQLEEIEARARIRFAIHDIGIVHRLGHMDPTECSVAIVATAPHRGAAFDACRFAIDAIKETVPIWKKEVYADGEAWIEDPE